MREVDRASWHRHLTPGDTVSINPAHTEAPARATAPTRAASRRNVIRGAAWTTAAVAVVVATPNIAAASGGAGGTVSAKGKREGKDLFPVATLVADSTSTLAGITAVVTINRGVLDPDWGAVNTGWSRTAISESSATYAYSGDLTPGMSLELAPFLRLTRNVDWSIIATIAFSWNGGSAITSVDLGK